MVQMDAQHRHQLQHHDLQDLTLQAVPWFERHGKSLVIGIVVALVLLLGGAIWLSSSEATHEAAWTKLSTATTVDEFGAVADAYPGSLAAAWAQLRSAEFTLESGVAAMFTDRELALGDLKSSRENFEKVLSASVDLPENVRERAILGMARCLEATCDGNTEPVVAAYQKLITQFPNSAYKKVAEEKILALQTEDAKQFYTWFHQQAPKPAAFPRPNDGGLPSTPAGNPFELPPPANPPAGNSPAGSPETEKPASADATSETPETKSPTAPATDNEAPASTPEPATEAPAKPE